MELFRRTHKFTDKMNKQTDRQDQPNNPESHTEALTNATKLSAGERESLQDHV